MSQDIKTYKRIMHNGEPHYGQHLMLTATGCNDALIDLNGINDFIKELVIKIDMVAFGAPIIARFGQGDEIGISAVQLIETSAITLHTNDKYRDLYLDVFSCKEYNSWDAVKVVENIFQPTGLSFEGVYRK